MLELLAELIGRIVIELVLYAMILYPGAAVLWIFKRSPPNLSKIIDNQGVICFLFGMGIWVCGYFVATHLIGRYY